MNTVRNKLGHDDAGRTVVSLTRHLERELLDKSAGKAAVVELQSECRKVGRFKASRAMRRRLMLEAKTQ